MDQATVISLVGTAITVVAFAITVMQLRRTANATQAAKSAITTLRNRMSTFDTASENLKASKALQHAVKFLRLGRWDDAASSLWEAQISINRLEHLSPESDDDGDESTADYLLSVVTDLEDASDKNLDYEAKSLIVFMRKQINHLESHHLSRNQELLDV